VIVLYGIKSCDSCRKARKFLEANGLTFRFHDLREAGVDAALLERWIDVHGPDTLVNRRSTTWRELDAKDRERAGGGDLLRLLMEYPTLIKRPILQAPNACIAGFREADYRESLLHE
jgi:arsenate reductase (glutaredoxin)